MWSNRAPLALATSQLSSPPRATRGVFHKPHVLISVYQSHGSPRACCARCSITKQNLANARARAPLARAVTSAPLISLPLHCNSICAHAPARITHFRASTACFSYKTPYSASFLFSKRASATRGGALSNLQVYICLLMYSSAPLTCTSYTLLFSLFSLTLHHLFLFICI